MTEEDIVEGKNLVESLKNATNTTQRLDPYSIVHFTIIDFFHDRIQKIKKDELLKDIVKDAIVERIQDPDSEITFAQLNSFFNDLTHQANSASQNLFGLFKPNMDQTMEETDKKGDTPIPNLNKEDREVLHKLSRIVQNLQTSEEE